ncbi:MAG: RNA-binding protein [Candidatus Woesearchaeota archaeon]|nr:MAG: RNA-binding protein [Candidatus Woesearchaeota archaeon]
MNKEIKKIKSQAKTIKASILIGKNGITDEIIKNIKNYLKNNEVIKIKFLKTYIEGKNKKEVALQLASKCDAKLIDLTGFTVVLKK